MGNAVNRGRFTTWRMMVIQVIMFVYVAGTGVAAFAETLAQEESSASTADESVVESETAAEKSAVSAVDRNVFVNKETGLRLERAGGWLEGVPSQGAVALFRAAGSSQAQIEFRVSEDISEDRRNGYISAFHNSLLRVGFVQLESQPQANYSGRIGTEHEYRVLSDGREFRLIAWLYGHEKQMWIVTGFFPLSKRDVHYRGFRSMVRSMEFIEE